MTVKISIPASVLMAGSVGRQTIGSLGSSEDSTNASLKKTAFNERHPKVVRSFTVVAYIFSVSLAAIVLSAYYVVLWTPSPGDAQKNANANRTITPCGGVTHGPEGEVIPQYHRYSSSRFKSRLSSQARYYPARRRIDSNHLSLQQDSPYPPSSKNKINSSDDEDETYEKDSISSYEVTIEIPKTRSSSTTSTPYSAAHKSRTRSVLFEKMLTSSSSSRKAKIITTTTAIPTFEERR